MGTQGTFHLAADDSLLRALSLRCKLGLERFDHLLALHWGPRTPGFVQGDTDLQGGELQFLQKWV